MVYLSDIPELPDRDDPLRRQHYLEVARLLQPPAGQPGSAGSGRWGTFDQVVSVRHLNFICGTRIELELVGPEEPARSSQLRPGDPVHLTLRRRGRAYHLVNAADFLAVLSECGRRIDDVAKSEGSSSAVWTDSSARWYVTVHDAMAVDWIERKNSVPMSCLRPTSIPRAYAYRARSVAARISKPLRASKEVWSPTSVQQTPAGFSCSQAVRAPRGRY